MTGAANLGPNAFAGTARAYLRFRPPYPRALLDDLLVRAAAPTDGALLDLACGPGRVALDLAGSFAKVWAVDLEPEMIAVGRQEAERRGIAAVTWRVGRAEDVDLRANSVDLITIGEAFHRLDQRLIVEKSLHWLKPGGGLATLGTVGLLDGREPWQRQVAEVARRWMDRAFPAGWGRGVAGADLSPGAGEHVLSAAGFAEVATRDFEEPHDWSVGEIIGYLQSTSVCSQRALGADFPAFEAELRAALDPVTPYRETLRAGYTFGRKPII